MKKKLFSREKSNSIQITTKCGIYKINTSLRVARTLLFESSLAI